MKPTKEAFEPLENFTDEQLADIVRSNDALDQEEEERRLKEESESTIGKTPARNLLRKIRRSPLEIVNRSLFFLFIGSFLVSFASVYSTNPVWFFWYVVSAFSCVLYTPNRKALKELVDAWPNINDLIRGRSLWKK